MLAIEIVAVLAFLSSAQAFKVPANMTNGLYAFGYDNTGAETYHKISEARELPTEFERLAPAAKLLPSRLAKRKGSSSINARKGVNCNKDGAILDYNDVMGAQAILGMACDGLSPEGRRLPDGPIMVPDHEGRVAVYGTAQVFMCNMGAEERGCSSENSKSQLELVAMECANAAGKTFRLSEHKTSIIFPCADCLARMVQPRRTCVSQPIENSTTTQARRNTNTDLLDAAATDTISTARSFARPTKIDGLKARREQLPRRSNVRCDPLWVMGRAGFPFTGIWKSIEVTRLVYARSL